MEIRKVGVLGCGLMGSGIAQVCASAGFETTVLEVEQKYLDKGFAGIEKSLAKFAERPVEKGGITAQQKDAIRARLKGTTVAGWWPGVPTFASALVTARFEGPWTQLRHGGKAQIDGLDLAPLRPVGLKLDWEGKGVAVDKLTAAASSGEAQISLSGSSDGNGARVDELRIQKLGTVWLALEKPTRVDWLPTLRCEPLVLRFRLWICPDKAGEPRLADVWSAYASPPGE